MADWLTNWGKDVMWKRRQTESQGRSWPKPIMQVILVPGKGGKLKVKGGADPNQLYKSSWYLEKGGTDPNIFDFIISDYSIIVKWLTDILLFDPNWPKSTWIDWNWPKLIKTDQNWLKLTKIYQNQPRLTQIDRNWPKLIEIDPNWPNSTQIDKIGGQYASASALASGQVTTKPVRKHWHDDKKLESQCVSTGVRTRYYNEDETKSKWVIDWQLTDWLTDWLLTDWLRLTEETEVRRTENLWFLVSSHFHIQSCFRLDLHLQSQSSRNVLKCWLINNTLRGQQTPQMNIPMLPRNYVTSVGLGELGGGNQYTLTLLQ